MINRKMTSGLNWMLVFVFILLAAPELLATEWQIVGPRALGMGGANVAVANDATASYWNPGAFGFFNNGEEGDYEKRGWSTTLVGVGVGVQLHDNIGEDITNIADADFDGLTNESGLSAGQVTEYIQLINDLKSFGDNGSAAVGILANGGSRWQFGHFGLAGVFFADIGIRGDIDFRNIAPVNATGVLPAGNFLDDFTNPANLGCDAVCAAGGGQTALNPAQRQGLSDHIDTLGWSTTQRDNYITAVDNGLAQSGAVPADIVAQLEVVTSTANLAANAAGGGSIDDNESKLVIQAMLLTEIPLTYGREISPKLAVGGNLKYMQATVINDSVAVFGEDEDISDKLDTAKDTKETNVGLDLGALYLVNEDLRVGLVGRNLNSPKFGPFKERMQLRTGLAYQPKSYLLFAADLDLTENETKVRGGYKSRTFAAGVELNFFKFLQFRGGFYRNLSEDDIGLVYTAGLGVNLWLINIDIGAAMSKDQSELDGDSIPEEGRVEFALSMLF